MAMMPTRMGKVVRATITREANATQYTAGDAVSSAAAGVVGATLSNVTRTEGHGGIIRACSLHKSDQDLTAAEFDVYVFDTNFAAAGNQDNVAIAVTDAEWAAGFVGAFRFAAADGASVVTGDAWTKSNLDLPFQCVALSRDLYILVVARDTYTPASAEVFTLSFLIESD